MTARKAVALSIAGVVCAFIGTPFTLVAHSTERAEATRANAPRLPRKQCLARSAMQERLKKENQTPLVIVEAKRITGSGVTSQRIVYTSDAELRAGYQITVNESGAYCVDTYIKNLVILDGRRRSPDLAAYRGRDPRSPPGSLASAITAASEKFNEVPYLQFNTDQLGSEQTLGGPDGGNRSWLVTITGHPVGTSGSGDIIQAFADGRGYASVGLTEVSYTPVAIEFLKRTKK